MPSAAARGAIDLAEAVLLRDRVGETFDAGGDRRRQPAPHRAGPGQPPNGREPGGTVALDDPPVRARCTGDLPLGERVRVTLVTADPVKRTVLFTRK